MRQVWRAAATKIVAIVTLCMLPTCPRAQVVNQQQLDAITSTADRICSVVRTEGSTESAT